MSTDDRQVLLALVCKMVVKQNKFQLKYLEECLELFEEADCSRELLPSIKDLIKEQYNFYPEDKNPFDSNFVSPVLNPFENHEENVEVHDNQYEKILGEILQEVGELEVEAKKLDGSNEGLLKVMDNCLKSKLNFLTKINIFSEEQKEKVMTKIRTVQKILEELQKNVKEEDNIKCEKEDFKIIKNESESPDM